MDESLQTRQSKDETFSQRHQRMLPSKWLIVDSILKGHARQHHPVELVPQVRVQRNLVTETSEHQLGVANARNTTLAVDTESLIFRIHLPKGTTSSKFIGEIPYDQFVLVPLS